jgi:hypothetical protein
VGALAMAMPPNRQFLIEILHALHEKVVGAARLE